MDRDHTEKLREQAKGGKKPLPAQGDNTEIRVVEGLLNEQDLQDLRDIARQKVLDEYKDAERALVLKRMIEEERGKHDKEEEMVDCLINLPGHAACVKINMKPYWHGVTYTVPISVFRTLEDIMFNAWKHEDVVGNVNRSRNQPVAQNRRVSARTMQETTLRA